MEQEVVAVLVPPSQLVTFSLRTLRASSQGSSGTLILCNTRPSRRRHLRRRTIITGSRPSDQYGTPLLKLVTPTTSRVDVVRHEFLIVCLHNL